MSADMRSVLLGNSKDCAGRLPARVLARALRNRLELHLRVHCEIGRFGQAVIGCRNRHDILGRNGGCLDREVWRDSCARRDGDRGRHRHTLITAGQAHYHASRWGYTVEGYLIQRSGRAAHHRSGG